jgi:hypothetical protein
VRSLRAPGELLDELAEIVASCVPESEIEATLVALTLFAEAHPDMHDRLRFLSAREVDESGPIATVEDEDPAASTKPRRAQSRKA